MAETLSKVTVFFAHTAASIVLYANSLPKEQRLQIWIWEAAYLLGLVAVHAFYSIIHPLILAPAFPFLPLLVYSVYCALGIVYCWVLLYAAVLKN